MQVTRGLDLMYLLATYLLLTEGVTGIPLNEFYPFGVEAGDTLVPRTDDGSSPAITLPRQFYFFGQFTNTIYVNSNGHLSLNREYRQYNPEMFPFRVPLIAVFWADVDIRPLNGGNIWYRITNTSDLLQQAKMDIQRGYEFDDDREIDYLLIATWDHVGYYNSHIDKKNTFQCVLAVSMSQTYAIYLYADGLIQWTAGDSQDGENGTGGNGALVGYNAGDGFTSFTVPGSQTDGIMHVEITSNVHNPGMWLFRLDREDILLPSCVNIPIAELHLSPHFGSQLGGTAVNVRGPCFNESDTVECIFDKTPTPGIYVNRDSVICVSPVMTTYGRVNVTVQITDANKHIKFKRDVPFTSIPIQHAHGVNVQPSLIVELGRSIEVSWKPNDIFPTIEDPNSFMVEVYFYVNVINNKKRIWLPIHKQPDIPNSGQASFTLFYLPNDLRNNLSSAIIHVTVGKVNDTSINKELIKKIQMQRRIPFPFRVGIWSGLLLVTDASDGRRQRDEKSKFEKQCLNWRQNCRKQQDDVNLREFLLPCPPTLDRARLPNSGLEELRFDSFLFNTTYHSQLMDIFHPGVSKCFVQAIVSSGSPGQECCYNAQGNLVVGSPGGGSVNRFVPYDFQNHVEEDLIPYLYCCPETCIDYFRCRPSDDGTNYKPPPPACIYGDPHVITLDGLQYTFNGKGEFILIETVNDTFTLQGRMVEVPAADDSFVSNAPATVFSAIVGKEANSDTVQFTLGSENEIITTVNGEPVDFEMLNEESFLNVIVMDKGNRTYAAAFASGAYVEVTSNNGFISLLLVSLSNYFMNKTSGLMGSFNGDIHDDLVPRNDTGRPISINSTLEEIHHQFGLTWIINNPQESLFTYRETLGESWAFFYDPDYIPAFAPTFDDPVLEERANEICGDSLFCLFDIAATERLDIGLTTAIDNVEYDMVVNMSQPVVCIPSCENGACVAINTCLCTEGYSGDTCAEAVMTDCEENLCKSGGTCQMLAGSVICTCPPNVTGVLCELFPPPEIVTDAVADTPLMSVSLLVDPFELGFIDYRHLISLCYEVRGTPRKTFNLISTKCTSVNARYVSLNNDKYNTIINRVGIRTVNDDGKCMNIQVNEDCSVRFNGRVLSSNITEKNISIELSSNSVLVSLPNCGKQIDIYFFCHHISDDNTPVMNMTITRNYIDQDITHGLIGQFWSAAITAEPFEGDTAGLIPGYSPYTLKVDYPEVPGSRQFVGALVPRLWNHDSSQCIYAGNSQAGSTGTGPSSPKDSVIEGELRDYRVRSLFEVEFAYSKFETNLCFL